MQSIAECLTFLKKQYAFHANRFNSLRTKSPSAASKHEATALEFGRVISYLEECENLITSERVPPPGEPDLFDTSELFSISESDISALPDSVRNSLKLSDTDKLESQVIELIKIAGRPLNVKELIIGLYKKYGVEIEERNPFAAKLYRMCQHGTIRSVDGKRGYYEIANHG